MEKIKLISNRFEDADVKMEIVAVDKASNIIERVATALDKAAESQERYNESNDQSQRSNANTVSMFKQLLSQISTAIQQFDALAEKTKVTSSVMKKMADLKSTLFIKSETGSLFDESKMTESSVISMSKMLSGILKTNIDLKDKIAKENAKRAQEVDDTASYEKATNAINKNSNALNRNADSSNKAEGGFSGLIKKVNHFAVSYRIFSGFIGGIGRSVMNLYDNAASYEEAMNLYRTSFGDMAKAADKWAERISTALYLDPKDVMQYAGAFYNLVKGLGVGSEAAYKMATNLTQLSYDMSSYLNIDQESAYEKVTSAITGQSRAVVTAGVAMQAASLQETAYSLGIKKKVAAMTQAEKTYLRYIQIMNQTKNMQQDLGKTIVTPENALRLMRNQFTLLGRAIGNVFIPIILKAIPYVMALTQVLTELAGKLANWAGYKIQDVDYSNIEKMTGAMNDLGDSAEGTGGKINRTLAAFDDLNVVESKSSGSGSGSKDSVIGDLEKYIDGYDMLGKLTADMDKNVEAAKKSIENLIPKLKTLGIAFGAIKLLPFIAKLKKGGEASALFSGALTKFKEGLVAIYEWFTKDSIITAAFGDGLAGLLSTVLTVGSSVLGFFTSIDMHSTMMDLWKSQNYEVTGSIWGLSAATEGTLAASSLLLATINPLAGALMFLGGNAYILYDTFKTLKEETKALHEEQSYLRLQFENTGTQLEVLPNVIDKLLISYRAGADEQLKFAEAVDTARDSMDKAKEAANELELDLALENFDDIKTAYDTITNTNNSMRDSIISVDTAERTRMEHQLKRLYEEGIITKEEYQERMNVINKYYDTLDAHAKGYYDELSKHQKDLANGTITQDQYNQKVAELKEKYSDVSKIVNDAAGSFGNYAQAMINGIDLSNASVDDMKNTVSELSSSHENYINKITEGYNAQHDANQRVMEEMSAELASLEKGSKAYNEKKDALDAMVKTQNELSKKYKDDMEVVNATFYKSLQTMYNEMSDAGIDADTEFSKVMKSIKDEMSKIGDVDTSKAAKSFVGTYIDELEKNSKSVEVKTGVNKSGEKISEYYVDGVLTAVKAKENQVITNTEILGRYITRGVALGIDAPDEKSKVTESLKKVSDMPDDVLRTLLKVHSPSQVTEEIGRYVTEGLAVGITDGSVISALNNSLDMLATNVRNKLSRIDVDSKLSINTSVEDSFNSLLNKLQTFCNNWRNAINDLAKNMKSTMNGISVDKNGKVSYTTMPKVNVAKFADGGYPTKGDLFFMNENGPEYMASIGNRTAVANQDQMAAVITNAVIAGFDKLQPRNNQPGITQVYIGNDKVYEGHGTYQNRQADRYGTTYIKI